MNYTINHNTSFDDIAKQITAHGHWQEAVDAAAATLLIEQAREMGLIAGGPRAMVERAYKIALHGECLGYTPSSDVPKVAAEIVKTLNAGEI